MKDFVKFLVLSALIFACEGEEDGRGASSKEYMPLQGGNFWIYDVREKRYAPGTDPQVSHYELMTVVVDSIPSIDGKFTYVLHRHRRDSESDPWQPVDTWSARNDHRELVIAEGNTSYVKLRYPVTEASRWDGNALNGTGPDEYEYTAIGSPLAFDGLTFDETVTVVQEKNDDVIVFRDMRTEIFARDAGLVFKEIVQLNFCTDDDCLGQQKVVEGIDMTMVIKAYGK